MKCYGCNNQSPNNIYFGIRLCDACVFKLGISFLNAVNKADLLQAFPPEMLGGEKLCSAINLVCHAPKEVYEHFNFSELSYLCKGCGYEHNVLVHQKNKSSLKCFNCGTIYSE